MSFIGALSFELFYWFAGWKGQMHRSKNGGGWGERIGFQIIPSLVARIRVFVGLLVCM